MSSLQQAMIESIAKIRKDLRDSFAIQSSIWERMTEGPAQREARLRAQNWPWDECGEDRRLYEKREAAEKAWREMDNGAGI